MQGEIYMYRNEENIKSSKKAASSARQHIENGAKQSSQVCLRVWPEADGMRASKSAWNLCENELLT